MVEGEWVLIVGWVLCIASKKERHSIRTDPPTNVLTRTNFVWEIPRMSGFLHDLSNVLYQDSRRGIFVVDFQVILHSVNTTPEL